jgi:hypothetical protein
MGIKEFYYKQEDAWYRFVEKTGLYKITDKIDKVMPSFVLCILIVLILIAGITLYFVNRAGVPNSIDVSFYVKDDSGIGIPSTQLQFYSQLYEIKPPFIMTDDEGKTNVVQIPKEGDFNVIVDAISLGFAEFNRKYNAEEYQNGDIIPIVLEPVSIPQTKTYSFSIVDNDSLQNITKGGIIEFSCSNLNITPPSKMSIPTNGEVTVNADPDCGLKASIVVNGYQQEFNVPITDSVSSIYLNPLANTSFSEPENYSLTVYVRDSITNAPLSSITVVATNSFGVNAGQCNTSSGSCVIPGLSNGEYTLSLSDTSGSLDAYSPKTVNVMISDSNKQQTVILSKDVKGYTKVIVKDQSTNAPLKNVNVYWKTINTNTGEVKKAGSFDTGADGSVVLKLGDDIDPDLKYYVVADMIGYIISSKYVVPKQDINEMLTYTILLEKVTPSSVGKLKVKVFDAATAKALKYAKVILYDSATSFPTDFPAITVDHKGEGYFNVPNGEYYAVAVKGSSKGQSESIKFNVRDAETYDPLSIPVVVANGRLNVSVVDEDNVPLQNIQLYIYDKETSLSSLSSAMAIAGELTNQSGNASFSLEGDSEIFVVAKDILGGDIYGTTQTSFIHIPSGLEKNIVITLYPKVSSTDKPKLLFRGLYKDDLEMSGGVAPGEEYVAKFTLLVPDRYDGTSGIDNQEFEHVGVILKTNSETDKIYVEQDDWFIKFIDVPHAYAIERYTQFDYYGNGEVDGIEDEESLTQNDAKWVKILFKDGSGQYYNAYEIDAILKVRDTAIKGEKLKLNYFSFGYNNDTEDYEISHPQAQPSGTSDEIQYYLNAYETETYTVGAETSCSAEICFSSTILDNYNHISTSVTDTYSGSQGINYTFSFNLINNNNIKTYTNARIKIENKDRGLPFEGSVELQYPGGNESINVNGNYLFDTQGITITLPSKRKISGTLNFKGDLSGERHLVITFISDNEPIFTKDILINISSEKELDLKLKPSVIPANTPFTLTVEQVKNKQTGEYVQDAQIYVKDAGQTLIAGPQPIGETGQGSISVPGVANGDKLYVNVVAPDYQTYVKELSPTKNVFKIDPAKLSTSLDIYNRKSELLAFDIVNLTTQSIKINSLELKGENLDIIDLQKINASLSLYKDQVIPGIAEEEENLSLQTLESKQQIQLNIMVNPKAEMITSVQNLKATLKVSVASTLNPSVIWNVDVPVLISVGFSGQMEHPDCITVNPSSWKEVTPGDPITTVFSLNNDCAINGLPIPLTGGLQAKIEFDSAPLGTFNLSIGNKLAELSHGQYKTLYEFVPKDQSYTATLEYIPDGRYAGNIKGKIIFKSDNPTQSGTQEITSEYAFDLDVLSLKDCYIPSSKVITLYQNPVTLSIENKGCGVDTTYHLWCEDCQAKGIQITPIEGIQVPATGASQEITISRSSSTIPGQYLIYVYSQSKGSYMQQFVGNIKLIVRPAYGECIDLAKYEFDLFRQEYSEATGGSINTTSFDYTDMYNYCYRQQISGEGKMSTGGRLGVALARGIIDGLYIGLSSWGLQEAGIMPTTLDNKIKNSEKDIEKLQEDYEKAKGTEKEIEKGIELAEAKLEYLNLNYEKICGNDVNTNECKALKSKIQNNELALSSLRTKKAGATSAEIDDLIKKIDESIQNQNQITESNQQEEQQGQGQQLQDNNP